jgi:murein endopeptidase
MKKLFGFLALGVVFLLTYSCFVEKPAQGEPKDAIKSKTGIPSNVFMANESINFGVYSNGIKVGSGSLVYNGIKKQVRLKRKM